MGINNYITILVILISMGLYIFKADLNRDNFINIGKYKDTFAWLNEEVKILNGFRLTKTSLYGRCSAYL